MSDDAERALDAYDEAQRDSKAPKRHGEHRYATPVSVDGTPLEGGLAREAFLEYAAKQAESADRDDGLGDLIDRRRPREGWDASEYGEFRPNAESGT